MCLLHGPPPQALVPWCLPSSLPPSRAPTRRCRTSLVGHLPAIAPCSVLLLFPLDRPCEVHKVALPAGCHARSPGVGLDTLCCRVCPRSQALPSCLVLRSCCWRWALPLLYPPLLEVAAVALTAGGNSSSSSSRSSVRLQRQLLPANRSAARPSREATLRLARARKI